MAAASAIEWTDATWNPVTGCDRVSPGCAHCYALTLAKRLKAMGQPRYQRDGDPRTSGPGFGVTLHPHKLDEPLRWRKPRMVFVNSMSDLFHDEVPDDFIARVFAVMALAPRHTFQVLTKRPERAKELLDDVFRRDSFQWWVEHHVGKYDQDFEVTWPLPNVWLGVSIENARYTSRADVLREIPAAVRFISAEPLLGSLYPKPACSCEPIYCRHRQLLREHPPTNPRAPLDLDGIGWVIVGGESGPGARPMHPDWAREIRDACLAATVCPHGLDLQEACYCQRCEAAGHEHQRPRFFFKQWGEWLPYEQDAQPPFWKAASDGSLYDGHHLPVGLSEMHRPERGRNGHTWWWPHPDDDPIYRLAGKKHAGRLLDGREWNELPAVRT